MYRWMYCATYRRAYRWQPPEVYPPRQAGRRRAAMNHRHRAARSRCWVSASGRSPMGPHLRPQELRLRDDRHANYSHGKCPLEDSRPLGTASSARLGQDTPPVVVFLLVDLSLRESLLKDFDGTLSGRRVATLPCAEATGKQNRKKDDPTPKQRPSWCRRRPCAPIPNSTSTTLDCQNLARKRGSPRKALSTKR
jgi:hypothetical protein